MTWTNRRRLALAGVLFSLALAPLASAGDFDGSKTLQCVPTDMFECTRGVGCERATAEEINIPHFLEVDFAKKVVRGTVNGKPDTSPIEKLHTEHGRTALHGVEGGMAWIILIDQSSGKMSMSIATSTHGGHPVGFSILGVCTTR
jgi:hypothetical protein